MKRKALFSFLLSSLALPASALAYSQVAFSYPPAGNTVSFTVPVIISFAQRDGDRDDVEYAKVWVDGEFLGTVTRKAATLQWDTTEESNGIHTLTVKGYAVTVEGHEDQDLIVGTDKETVTTFNRQ